MPTYITLLQFTQQGIGKIKASPNRLDAVKQTAKAKGCELKSFYLTLGHYDAVAVFEGPDDESLTELMLSIASQGNVRTETLRAFTEEEYRKIIGAVS